MEKPMKDNAGRLLSLDALRGFDMFFLYRKKTFLRV